MKLNPRPSSPASSTCLLSRCATDAASIDQEGCVSTGNAPPVHTLSPVGYQKPLRLIDVFSPVDRAMGSVPVKVDLNKPD